MKTKLAGFTLVEAIVALLVLSLTFTAVWGWFGAATESTRKIENALALPQVFNQFAENIELESLQNNREGVIQIDRYLVYWRADIDRQSSKEGRRRQPAWIVTLFNVDAEVVLDGNPVSVFSTKVVRQWRDPNFVELPRF